MAGFSGQISRFISGFIPRFLRRRTPSFIRQHDRFPCVLIANMGLIEIEAKIEGLVMELSMGGCSFRPASMYLLDRIGEEVLIETRYFSAKGIIRAVRQGSYGVQFYKQVSYEILSSAIDVYEIYPNNANLGHEKQTH